jgi:hypothetical protein
MDYRLEVIGIPVSDVDASKAFYSGVVGFAATDSAWFAVLYRHRRGHAAG